MLTCNWMFSFRGYSFVLKKQKHSIPSEELVSPPPRVQSILTHTGE